MLLRSVSLPLFPYSGSEVLKGVLPLCRRKPGIAPPGGGLTSGAAGTVPACSVVLPPGEPLSGDATVICAVSPNPRARIAIKI